MPKYHIISCDGLVNSAIEQRIVGGLILISFQFSPYAIWSLVAMCVELDWIESKVATVFSVKLPL